MLTAYTASMAELLAPHVDMLLVGDSVGMVLHGMENTLGVTLDMMVLHGQAVMRGLSKTEADCFVVVDMPYGTYEHDADQALRNARRLIQETGAHAVKLEGGADMADIICTLVDDGIPVVGHIGLQPQSVEKEGGYKIKGRDEAGVQKLLSDAKAVEEAGAFCFVLEGTLPDAAQAVTQAVSIPTIGIGASAACDGQVLVIDDMLGLHRGHVPKFVKQYARLADQISGAAANYSREVQSSQFPAAEHLYGQKKTPAPVAEQKLYGAK